MMNFPKKLRKGDTVGIICPSSPIATERIGQCVDAINRLGYNVKLADADYKYKNPKGFELGVLKSGKATGQLTGGNLSLLSASMGTPYEVDTKDKIIFLEEVSEPVYNIDKWMHQLRFAGKLQECKGILLGQFTDVVNKRCPEYDVNQCVMEALDGIDIPVMYNIQSGHEKPMTTLPLGAMCTMDTEDKTITFQVTR